MPRPWPTERTAESATTVVYGLNFALTSDGRLLALAQATTERAFLLPKSGGLRLVPAARIDSTSRFGRTRTAGSVCKDVEFPINGMSFDLHAIRRIVEVLADL